MIATEIDTYQDQHAAFKSESSPEWLVALRQRGLDAFTRLGLPNRRLEDWRFTNIASLTAKTYEVASLIEDDNDEADELAAGANLDDEYHRLVFVNGRYSEKLSRRHDVPAGVVIDSLSDAVRHRPDDVRYQLENGIDFDQSAFTALNTAFVSDGAIIDVPDAVTLDRPIHLVFLSVGNGRTVSHPRNLIRVGKGSSADVIESYQGQGDSYFTNAVTQVTVADGAELNHHKLQHEQVGALHIATTGVDQKDSSRFRSHYFSFGASIARNELDCLLDGEQIETTLNGLYLPTGDQLMDCRTRIDHAKPNCNSYELYKGILDDKARGVFNGKIFVRQDAQKTDAKQSNQALLLSDDAVVNTKPQLEIYADDVRCTHGATIGELEQDALYYLRSRGVPMDLARQILIFAFANDVVQGVQLPALKRHLESVLLAGHDLSEDIL